MSTRKFLFGIVAAAALGAAGYGLYSIGMQRGMAMTVPADTPGAAGTVGDGPVAAGADAPMSIAQGEAATRRHIAEGLKAGEVDPATGRRILYYHDPMVPGKKFDAPAKSPFMDMMLVPQYAGAEGADASTITVSPRIQQNLGLRTAQVQQGALAPQVSAVGTIAWSEREQALLQARAGGFVEKLHVRATLDRVAEGAPLADIYVPDWVAAQEEYLALRRMQGEGLGALVDAARQRMRLAGMNEAQIAQVQSTGLLQPRFSLTAPIAGLVTELMLREGMTVMPGMTLARIQGTARVWADAEVPESQAAQLRAGMKVSATSPGAPGRRIEGRVQQLLPEVNPATRTRKARLELANPRGDLVPGLFVEMAFDAGKAKPQLLVPSEAVIHTGRRAVVMLAEDDGRFRPLEIKTGLEIGGQTEVIEGLSAGQRVVLSGQFLIDSEASLKGLEARLNPAGAPAAATHSTDARIDEIGGDTVTLTHPAIPALKWPGMQMDFRLPARDQRPRGLAAGDRVRIEFRVGDGDVPQITTIRRAAPATVASKAANAAGSADAAKPAAAGASR